MGYDSSKADSFLSNMTLSLFRLELGSYFTILSLDIESYIRTCTLIFHFQEGDMAFVPTTSVLRNETLCLIIRYIFPYGGICTVYENREGRKIFVFRI